MPETMNKEAMSQSVSFDAIRIGLASPEKIREWSNGEVKKPSYDVKIGDIIEIKFGGNHSSCVQDDLYYTGSKAEGWQKSEKKIYSYVYHYQINVNNTKFGCLHISSVDEINEEKLAEIIQMMGDSLVVLNTEEFFIWRCNIKT